MKNTRIMMDMHITVEINDKQLNSDVFEKIFKYFSYIDDTFSVFKKNSEISLINQKILEKSHYSSDMKEVLRLCEKTKKETHGYFDIAVNGLLDPSGLVKGWAVYHAAKLLKNWGYADFYIDAGGDIQVSVKNAGGKNWTVGIKNPADRDGIVKVLAVNNKGIATSGTYLRGEHIYNPFDPEKKTGDPVSLTVIGPNVLDADRMATAAFAMGNKGIEFIEKLKGFEGYLIDSKGTATFTSGFNRYVLKT